MRVKVIAEIGNGHEGSLGLAKKFIKTATECGVDAVKFQTHIFDAESTNRAPNPPYFNDETRKEYLIRTEFSLNQYFKLKRFCEDECKCEFMSSPFSIEAIKLLEELNIKTYKVPSGEVSNIPYLIELAKTGKSIILSSGMSTWGELDLAVNVLKSNGCKDLTVLQCTSEYPCPPKNSGLNILGQIKERYKCNVGFSDHTKGNAIAIAAVVLGAKIIEKHFTLSKNMYGSDAKFAAEPNQFRTLVNDIREIELALSHDIDKDFISENIREMKSVFEKSIVATRKLNLGDVIKLSDLSFKKPGDGIPARDYQKLIGKVIKKAINKDDQIHHSKIR